MNKLKINPLIIIVGILFLLSYLFIKSGLLGSDRFNALSKTTQKLKMDNQELDYDVLKVRVGMLRYYNTLDQGIRNLYYSANNISNSAQDLGLKNSKHLSGELHRSITDKEDAINHLKSDNGVLRNSLMYFSILSNEITLLYRNKFKHNAQLKRFVLVELPLLSSKIIEIIRNPNKQILDDNHLFIENKFRELSRMNNEVLRAKIKLILTHAEVINERTTDVNDAILKITSSNLDSHINKLEVILNEARRDAEVQLERYRVFFYAFSIMLALYLGYVVYRLKITSVALKNSVIEMRYQKKATDEHAIICIVDENENIIEVNKNYLQVYGYIEDEVLHKNYSNIHKVISEEKENIIDLSSRGEIWSGVVEDSRKSGAPVWFDMTVVPFINEKNNIYKKIFIGTDISIRREAAEKIKYHAYHDEVTSLPNRRMLDQLIDKSLLYCKENKQYSVLICLHLDNFNRLTNFLGHAAGNYLLIKVASRLVRTINNASIARLKGNEFGILLKECGDDFRFCEDITEKVISKIQYCLEEKFLWKNKELIISPNVGVTIFPDGCASSKDILAQAEMAMHSAQEDGGVYFKYYQRNMLVDVENRLELERELRRAIEHNELYLNIQPQYNGQGEVIGAETLLRWNNAKRGNITPAVFIPLAEETGLIINIGTWVLYKACVLLKQIQDTFNQSIPFRHLAVNVSAIQFMQTNFVDIVKNTLMSTGANPNNLELEITEGMLLSDIQIIIDKMHQLRKLGVRFSIDDFGTGYSSLMYLTKLPIEQLKIDQGFIRNLFDEPANVIIVETIILMAEHLEIEVIAEGVETMDELNSLQKMGCQYYQGYYFSKPVSVDVFTALLGDN